MFVVFNVQSNDHFSVQKNRIDHRLKEIDKCLKLIAWRYRTDL
ncbi:MAG: hypothetical protein JWQ54_3604 [Mucilaginibacter sp.]|nr:hypothetical protein [Mucilaginibacter sp.]